jgi:viroplasmin and RNaseH domain-containing protein
MALRALLTIDNIRDYVEDTPESWENIKGYGARLSAPGYLDCTEWSVFDTAEEAKAYLDENYPEEEDEEDDEDEATCQAPRKG